MAIQATSDLRLTLTRIEAARMLGISMDSFERYVQPEVRAVVRGRLRLYPLRELERWVEENSIPPAVEMPGAGSGR
jgi:hypothetical protein